VDVVVVVVAVVRALQVFVAVVVVVVARLRLLSIEPGSLEEYVPSIGPLELVIVVSTVRSSTMQGLVSRPLRLPHNP